MLNTFPIISTRPCKAHIHMLYLRVPFLLHILYISHMCSYKHSYILILNLVYISNVVHIVTYSDDRPDGEVLIDQTLLKFEIILL